MKRDEQGYLVFRNLTEWKQNSAYADTHVSTSQSEHQIRKLLLGDYGVDAVMVGERQGGQIVLAFELKGQHYQIPVRRARIENESQSQVARLTRQAWRVLHWYLKSLLEIRFLTPLEEQLMPFLMLETEHGNIRAAEAILGGLLRPALPEPHGEVIDGEWKEE